MNLAALPAVHPIAAQLDRVNGLLAQHEGNVEQARKSFGSSLAILQALYGTQNWRVIRARQELRRATSGSAHHGPAGTPTPVTYSTDSEMPSIPKSFSIRESFKAAVLKGARPIRVAVRQNVWPKWPASSRTTR